MTLYVVIGVKYTAWMNQTQKKGRKESYWLGKEREKKKD